MDEAETEINEPELAAEVDLLDGADGNVDSLLTEVRDLRAVASDPHVALQTRVEAYEDIIDSEVGDTSLVRARNVEREFGLRQIFLKFEGGNPTGTQKDRIAFAQAMDALRRGFEGLTVATCGNYGVAIALAGSLAGLRSLVFVPESYRTRRLQEMQDLGAEIRRTPGDYEAAVEDSRRSAAAEDLYDANPGGLNTNLQMRAYGEISYEIYDELRDAPAAVGVPISNGTTLASIYRGFLSLNRRGKTSRIPKLIGGSSPGKNPVVKSFLDGSRKCLDLDPETIRETSVNEPLVNWHSIDGQHALDAIWNTGGWTANASDRRMMQLARLLQKKEGVNVLPASTAGLIALIHRHERDPLPSDRYVVVVTGRKE